MDDFQAKCGFCDHAPTAFAQIVAIDTCRDPQTGEHLAHRARDTFFWGLCSDHAQAIPLRADAPYCLGPYEIKKEALRDSFERHYVGCHVTHWEVRMVPFASKEGAEHLAILKGKPQIPPPLHAVPIDFFSDRREYEEAFKPYGQPVYFSKETH